jgi:hypothetical protein
MMRGGAYWVRPLSSPFGLPLVSLLVASCFILLIDIFSVYLRCVHLTLNSSESVCHQRPTTHDLHLLSPRNTRLLATTSSQARARVAPGGLVRLRSMSCPSTSAGTGVPDDFACMRRDGARWHCDSFSRSQRPYAALSRALPTTLSRPRCLRCPRERPCRCPHRARARHLRLQME